MVKHSSIRILLALVAQFDLELVQLDVKIAFLHGNLSKEIYIKQPEGGLMYVMVRTSPDIAHAVGIVSKFMHNPGKVHWEAARDIFMKQGRQEFVLRRIMEELKVLN
ncbi:hypothetical protein L3X38_032019 [Prunus dulcis]|uniref:Reverse transcriptase Ty1/copia-type domain-containing protein n=1 Tax=Prunus dulcis TaxID=3755 RepID=A0AAD4VET9_PRUDU|nr:hypothetical protein L3X38_032019 [Prunus dulcis]